MKLTKKQKAELESNMRWLNAHNSWLEKYAGCTHEKKNVSLSHLATRLKIYRCANCGCQIDC